MNEQNDVAGTAALVSGAHRLIRSIGPQEGPFKGELVTYADAVLVSVRVEELKEWDGWAFGGAEHVAAAVDVRRRSDGHDVLLPWCTQRVSGFLGRRQVAEVPLVLGEVGTLAMSLVRGVRELGDDAGTCSGEWWLTADGCPMFVHGEGQDARSGAAHLLERLSETAGERAVSRMLQEMAATMSQPRHRIEEDQRWEEELFAAAAPRALRIDIFAPEPARAVRRLAATDSPDAAPGGASDSIGPITRARKVLETKLRSVWQLRIRPAKDRPRTESGRRPRPEDTRRPHAESTASTKRGPQRRSILVAAAVGAVVLGAGLLWPDGDGAEADPIVSVTATPSAEETPTSAEDEATGAPDAPEAGQAEEPVPSRTPVDAVSGLLNSISACVSAGEDQCPEAVAEGANVPKDGLAGLGADASTATLVDDYGDVAVIRLTPREEGIAEQMLVVERRNELWLVRDVYDVANQPE